MLTLFLLKSNNVERMFCSPTIYVGGGTKKMQTKCIFAVSITKLRCCHVLVKGWRREGRAEAAREITDQSVSVMFNVAL